LLAAVVAIHLGAALLTALIATGGRKQLLWISATALGINLALNWWLVPAYALEGAAAATLCTEAAVAGMGWIALARAGAAPRLDRARWLAVPAIAGVSWWVSQLAHSTWSAA
jgi:O-antigen/teichoic acid export membrane protein